MITNSDGRPMRVADIQQELEMITRLARMWSDNAGERLTEVRDAGVLGFAYSMDHLLRMEPVPERIAA